MSYRIRLDTLVQRQIVGWRLSDSLFVDVHLRLNDLANSPKDMLRPNTDLFDFRGMRYGFDLVDPDNRMLVHAFRFQVFYHSESGRLSVMASQFLCTSKSVDRYEGTRTSFKAVKATSDRHLQSILQTFHKRRHAV